MLASVLCFSSALFFSGNYLIIKILSIIEPEASPFLLIFLRSLACLFLLTFVGKIESEKDLKFCLTNPFKLLDSQTVLVGIGHNCFIIMIVFLCIKQLPIVSVLIFMNMGPLFSVLLAALFLSEKITLTTVFHLIIAVLGVFLMVLGA